MIINQANTHPENSLKRIYSILSYIGQDFIKNNDKIFIHQKYKFNKSGLCKKFFMTLNFEINAKNVRFDVEYNISQPVFIFWTSKYAQ